MINELKDFKIYVHDYRESEPNATLCVDMDGNADVYVTGDGYRHWCHDNNEFNSSYYTEHEKFSHSFFYICEEDASIHQIDVSFSYVKEPYLLHYNWGDRNYYKITGIEGFHVKDRKITKLVHESDFIRRYTREELEHFLSMRSPWLTKMLSAEIKDREVYDYRYYPKDENIYHVDPLRLLIAPYMEILFKAGYRFAKRYLCDHFCYDHADVEKLSRYVKPGKNPDEIFTVDKGFYSLFKNELDMSRIDNYRVMYNRGDITIQDLESIKDDNLCNKEIADMRAILRNEYNGKKIFTMESLNNYLHRIDMNEAIERYEGLGLLKDYLMACKEMEIEPRIDGDSLKREHDVTARNLLTYNDINENGKMATKYPNFNLVCQDNAKFNWENDDFIIRSVTDLADLKNEATQQHNCVFNYVRNIAERKSMIYVMRRKSEPDKSLVTIELSPSSHYILQKLMAYNQPIRDAAISGAIESWREYIKKGE